MKSFRIIHYPIYICISLLLCGAAAAQFLDDFDGTKLFKDPSAMTGWASYTGDGSAMIDFDQSDGAGSIRVDATKDKRNIWWALIRRNVTAGLDMEQLAKPGYELRIEARIRSSHAPRRVNLHLNTPRTTDFHSHLMEFDIPDTQNWHTISMTTRNFDAGPSDTVFAQMALMDWGLGKYRVDVDYLKVNVVEAATAGPDKGVQTPYHPPVPDINSYRHTIGASQDSIIDTQYPDMNFNQWYAQEGSSKTNLLTVSSTQFVILRWDLNKFAQKEIADYGLLELATYAVQRGEEIKDFGLIRVVEILGGDPQWDQKTVTYDSFCAGRPIEEVLNTQMIIDVKVSEDKCGVTHIPISRPVLQRMIDGRTLGLAIRPLGAINAAFYAVENNDGKHSPRLYFNTRE